MVKILVAHLKRDPDDPVFDFDPVDGEPVALPEPCARLRAGYWCDCGGFFLTARHAKVLQARVVEREDATPFDWVDDVDTFGVEVPEPSDGDRRAVRTQLEALPEGTVVDRHGITFAPRFARPRQGAAFGPAAAWPELAGPPPRWTSAAGWTGAVPS